MVAVDLVDCFYLFDYGELAELFSFIYVYYASEFGVKHIDMPNGECLELGDVDPIFCCLSTLPMGWN